MRKITRTVMYTEVTLLGVSKTQGESMNRTVTISGEITDEEKALKLAKKLFKPVDDFVPALVVDLNTVSETREMDEDFFIANSKIIVRPPSQRKNEEKKGE